MLACQNEPTRLPAERHSCRLVVRAVDASVAAELAELQSGPTAVSRPCQKATVRLLGNMLPGLCCFVFLGIAHAYAAAQQRGSAGSREGTMHVWPADCQPGGPSPHCVRSRGLALPLKSATCCCMQVRKALLARGWDLAWIDGVTGEIMKRRLAANVPQIEAAVRLSAHGCHCASSNGVWLGGGWWLGGWRMGACWQCGHISHPRPEYIQRAGWPAAAARSGGLHCSVLYWPCLPARFAAAVFVAGRQAHPPAARRCTCWRPAWPC